MRVLYLTRGIDIPGGMLIERLDARDDVSGTVLCQRGELLHSMKWHADFRVFKSRGKLDFAAIHHLRRELIKGQYDVVHTLTSRLLTNALLAARGLPNPPAVIGFVGFISRFSRWNPVHRLTYLHPRIGGICCNCQAAAEPLAECGVPREKLFTVYAGHPFRERPTPPDLAVRRELGLPDDGLVVGFAGNMRPVKGVDLLLGAAIELADVPALHWLLLGRVEDRRVEQLARHPAIRDRVHCLGWRDDAERLMTAMDIFAMPSRSEGFSRGMMEAMELGLCPVATRVGGTPEMVRDGVDGLIVQPNDATAIATAIRRLAHDPALRRSLAASARARIESTFTVDAMVEGMVQMYRTVASDRGPNSSAKQAA